VFAERIEAAREAERAGLWQEALARYEEALGLLPAGAATPDAARVLRWIGTVHRERGDLKLAEEAYRDSLGEAERCRSTADIAAVWNCLAIIAQTRGRLDDAETLYFRAHGLAQEAQDVRLMAMVNQNLGTLASIRGREAQALSSYRGAIARYRQLGDERSAAGALSNIGRVCIRLGEAAQAEEHLAEAARVAEQLGDADIASHVHLNRAVLRIGCKRYEEAHQDCDRAMAGMKKTGSKSGLGAAHKLYGMLYRELGECRLSEENLSQAVTLAREAEDRLLEAETHVEWARLHRVQGRASEALAALDLANRILPVLHVAAAVP
jgi:tetratricopeptide (TPR) repeat protein